MKSNIKYTYFLYLFLLLFVLACESSKTDKTKKKTIQPETENKIQEVDTLEESDKTSENDSFGLGEILLVVLGSIVISGAIVLFFIHYVPLKLWYEAKLSRVNISWFVLIKMRMQNIPQAIIIQMLIRAKNGGLTLSPVDLQRHYLAGVNIETVINTLIRAHNAKLKIELNDLAAQYLAKVDVEKIIHTLITAINANVEMTLNELASDYLAHIDIERLVNTFIISKNSGFSITIDELKQHMLSGGNLEKTMNAFVSAKKADIQDFEFKDIAAIDLSGADVIKAVHSAIQPKVHETGGVKSISRDGVELKLKVKVTFRALIKGIVGGANEETIMARVNESLATEIGLSESHYKVLQSPYELADKIEKKNLDANTGFEIISIDISEIEIGKDVHSELKVERAKAESEMAKVEVLRAEEKVQKAMAAAFLDGKLSIHDYHNMMNTEADTHMRKNLVSSIHLKDDKGGGGDHH